MILQNSFVRTKKAWKLIGIGGLLLLCLIVVSCRKQPESQPEKQPVKRPHVEERFHTEVMLKTTPVKDQGKSSLCWVYAMLATIETEHLMAGDSVNLSADFVARAFLKEQYIERCMAEKRMGDLGGDEITTRGIGSMLVRMIQTYGLTHYDAYHRKRGCNYNVLCRRLNKESGSALNMHSRSSIQDHINGILDEEIGPAPRFVFMLGAEYTAQEFARSVCRADEYESLTSFTHHPFGQQFPLEIPDNRYHDTFLNVPLDTLMERMDKSLRSGHPVCWEGDTSEKGFQWKQGVATLEGSGQRKVTQEERQEAFEQYDTTDDHCMAVVGIARDKKGGKFYIMKNSWGTSNQYRGFMYVSEDYVRMKTVALFIPRPL